MNPIREKESRFIRWQNLLEALKGRLPVWAPMLMFLFPGHRAAAATLPDERGDALYHYYDGGGQKVQGPALLMRKNFAEKASLSAGYYVDKISGASIDVVTNASPYREERREISAGAEYLYRDSLMSFSYTNSDENDFKARTLDFAVSQDLFDNRTTLTLDFSQGNDKVGKVHTDLSATANRAGYSVSVAQVINPTLIGSLSYELTAADGYLQNPYRSARVQGGTVPEIYPGTRSGHAVSQKFVKSWSQRWSTRIDYRYYWDSWQVKALNVGIGASRYVHNDWILEGSYRFYTQQAASFYSNNFQQPLDYMTRDKELAGFHSHTLGTKLTIPLLQRDHGVVNRVNVNFALDYMMFDYRDFTDVRNGQLYSFNAVVAQIFFTAFY